MGKAIYRGVGNVARKVKQPYVGVGGVARKIKNGYAGVGGVARQFFSGGTPISSISVGSTITLNVKSVPSEFIVVHHGIPSGTSEYDSTFNNGTWLLMKNVYTVAGSYSYTMNGEYLDFAHSKIYDYLNTTFLNLLDSDVRSAIKRVNLPYYYKDMYYVNNWDNPYVDCPEDTSGITTISTKVFLLSCGEIGWRALTEITAGAPLDYFSTMSYEDSGRIAYHSTNSYAATWWLRDPVTSSVSVDSKQYMRAVGSNGKCAGYHYSQNYYLRPALILPSNTSVSV